MKIRVTRTTDIDLIKSIVSNPESFATRAEDGLSITEMSPTVGPSIYWMLLISEEDGQEPEVRGLAIGSHLTHTVLDFHIIVLPQYWRSPLNAKLAALAVKYMLTHSTAAKVVATVPVTFQPVIRFLQRIGFKREGINRVSFRKNGKLVDQIYLGFTGE